MPIYMDLHRAPGVTAKEVAEAHYHDVLIEGKFKCKCITYWYDEREGQVFCLINAPDKDAVVQMHSNAHGLIPHEIIEVNTNVVEAFLGRIKDPEKLSDDSALNVFSEPALRVIMLIRTIDPKLSRHRHGEDKSVKMKNRFNSLIRESLQDFGGRLVESPDENFIISFVSAAQAIEYAQYIRATLESDFDDLGLRLGIDCGMPVEKNNELFGSTIELAKNLCWIAKPGEIIISQKVFEQLKNHKLESSKGIRCIGNAQEKFLISLMDTLAVNWNRPDFDVPAFCKSMLVSKPQLYRKSISVTGLSPNNLLREYRLAKALDLLKKENHNVSETTFDTGFTSPSYFAKCFYKKFEIHPLTYLKTA
jgi:AraC-like DNA-binding protein